MGNSGNETIDVDVIFIRETEKAVCVKSDEEADEVWIPKSLCEIAPKSLVEDDAGEGDVHSLSVKEWVAIDRGLV